jgi:hypothetical protein
MFVSTPFVRYVANRLFRQGKIDGRQHSYIVKQDLHLNVSITIAVSMLLIASYLL